MGEATDALKVRAEELRSEIQQTVDKSMAAAAESARHEAAHKLKLDTLRAECTEMAAARRSASSAVAAEKQAHAVRRNHMSELSLRLAGARVATQRFARYLQEVGQQGLALQAKLAEVRCRGAAAPAEVANCNAAYASLEAELSQQREAAAAWQSCVGELTQNHVTISVETARMASASREALCYGSPDHNALPRWSF